MPFSNSSFLVWKKKKQATVTVHTDAYKLAFISTSLSRNYSVIFDQFGFLDVRSEVMHL